MGAIISCISQKGGVGKSSLARSIGVEAVKQGIKTRICDLDIRQKTSLNWSIRRKEAGFEPDIDCLVYDDLAAALSEQDDWELNILDGPARVSESTLDIAKKSDLVILPSDPSKDSLEPCVMTAHELANNGIDVGKILVIITRPSTQKQVSDALTYIEAAGYHCLKSSVFDKPSYQTALNIGKAYTETTSETLNKDALRVINDITDVLRDIMVAA